MNSGQSLDTAALTLDKLWTANSGHAPHYVGGACRVSRVDVWLS